jgi:hypothetical protein
MLFITQKYYNPDKKRRIAGQNQYNHTTEQSI